MNMILIRVCLLKITFYKDGFISIDFSKLISLGEQRKSPSIFFFFGGGGGSQVDTQSKFQDLNVQKKYLGKLRHKFVLCVDTWRTVEKVSLRLYI
jgi:hypothetical protein